MEVIHDEYLKTVVFLCVIDTGATGVVISTPKATGFLVSVPLEGTHDTRVNYVVTARHCLEGARADNCQQLNIRLNRIDGPFFELPTKIDDWICHDSADIAVIRLGRLPRGIRRAEIDQAWFKIEDFVGPDYTYSFKHEGDVMRVQPRVGHQIYALGLFQPHFGTERNLPIARFGNISRMPETLSFDNGHIRFDAVVYLVELQSWGGQSGSPVFFMYPVFRQDLLPLTGNSGASLMVGADLMWVNSFMGIISGHFDIHQGAEITGDLKNYGTIQTDLNSGIAMITPAESVRQLLMREDLVVLRAQSKESIQPR